MQPKSYSNQKKFPFGASYFAKVWFISCIFQELRKYNFKINVQWKKKENIWD